MCGIGGSILYRIVRPLKLNVESSDDVTGGDLLEQLIKLNKGTESVKDALSRDESLKQNKDVRLWAGKSGNGKYLV